MIGGKLFESINQSINQIESVARAVNQSIKEIESITQGINQSMNLKFGRWNDQDLEWVVLDEDEFSVFVLCRTEITEMKFGSSSSWIESDVRNFLQKEFFRKAFSTEEKQKIINTKLSDVEDSKDNVFILSRNEVDRFIANEYVYNNFGNNRDWTRTKGDNYVISSIYTSGAYFSEYCYYTNKVRPAMYIKK